VDVERIRGLLREFGHDPACYEIEADENGSSGLRKRLGIGDMGRLVVIRADECPDRYNLAWASFDPAALVWDLREGTETPWQEEALDAAWREFTRTGAAELPRSAYQFDVRERQVGIVAKVRGKVRSVGEILSVLEVTLMNTKALESVETALASKDVVVEAFFPKVHLDLKTLDPIRLDDYARAHVPEARQGNDVEKSGSN